MHDLNTTLRFSDKLLLLKDGQIYAFGDRTLLNAHSIKEVFSIDRKINIENNIKLYILQWEWICAAFFITKDSPGW